MGLNFYYCDGLQPKMRAGIINEHECIMSVVAMVAKLKTHSEIFPPFKVTGFKQQLDWRPWREFFCGHYQPWKSGSQSQSVDRFAPRSSSQVKFIYSEKATKFCKIFPLLLTVCTVVKSEVKISQNFVAFSEYRNFKNQSQNFSNISQNNSKFL